MTPEQARALFNEHREPGDMAHYGEKAAGAAILKAVALKNAETASLRQSENSWKINYRSTMDVNAVLRAENAVLRAENAVLRAIADADFG